MIAEWGSTADERARPYPCDDVLRDPGQVLFRAVSIGAPPSVVFRWLCQLKVAPYSYDRIDNGGRRSPGELTPGVDHLVVGEKVMIFELASFAVDEHLTLVAWATAPSVTSPSATRSTRTAPPAPASSPRSW